MARFGHARNSPAIGQGEAKRATEEYPVRTLRGALEWCREHAAVVSFTEDGILVEAADLKASGRTFLLAVKEAQRGRLQRGDGK